MLIDRKFITECVTQVIKELSDKTYQDASEIAFDNDDMRVQKFRKQAEREYNQTRNGYRAHDRYDGFDNDGWIQLNNGKELFLFDDSYKTLQDLYNGVKSGRLLIHARGMTGEVTDDMKWIDPCFSETLQDAYGDEYYECQRGEQEYYDEDDDYEMTYPELVFASDDFSWCKNSRNGVFFIESDGFQKSLGDGKIQLPNGRICNYYEGEVYDYDNQWLRDEPICCEYGDWYSSQPARVVAILRLS